MIGSLETQIRKKIASGELSINQMRKNFRNDGYMMFGITDDEIIQQYARKIAMLPIQLPNEEEELIDIHERINKAVVEGKFTVQDFRNEFLLNGVDTNGWTDKQVMDTFAKVAVKSSIHRDANRLYDEQMNGLYSRKLDYESVVEQLSQFSDDEKLAFIEEHKLPADEKTSIEDIAEKYIDTLYPEFLKYDIDVFTPEEFKDDFEAYMENLRAHYEQNPEDMKADGEVLQRQYRSEMAVFPDDIKSVLNASSLDYQIRNESRMIRRTDAETKANSISGDGLMELNRASRNVNFSPNETKIEVLRPPEIVKNREQQDDFKAVPDSSNMIVGAIDPTGHVHIFPTADRELPAYFDYIFIEELKKN